MKHILMSLALLLSFTTLADVTFEHGVEYRSTLYSGHVRATCNNTSRSHYCRAEGLSPRMTTRLVSSEAINADKFEIVATWENGKTVSKKGKFKKGKSKSINLWIRSLFQRPLLNYGKNVIDYKLTRAGETVESGTFDVIVDEAPQVHCAPGWVRFFNDDDCNNASRACNEYFSRGYCSK